MFCRSTDRPIIEETLSFLSGCSSEAVNARAWLAPFEPSQGERDLCSSGEDFVPVTPFLFSEDIQHFSPPSRNPSVGFVNPSPTDPIDTKAVFQENPCVVELADFFLAFP